MEVGKTILQQIGSKALMMIGAKPKQSMLTKNGVFLKIGRNAKSVNYIGVELNVMDTYDMQFIRMRAGKKTVVSEVSGVYSDMLNSMIESNTGMVTSLF